MDVDNLGIRSNGNLCWCSGGEYDKGKHCREDYKLIPDFADDENCTFIEMEDRIYKLVHEIVG